MKKILAALGVMVILSLACGNSAPRRLDLYPTPSVLPTQTERVVIWTQTPRVIPTQTERVVILTQTPNALGVCEVAAVQAVFLRPAPNDQNYPITSLSHGAQVEFLGGRKGAWLFVRYGDRDGWINGIYLSGEACQ